MGAEEEKDNVVILPCVTTLPVPANRVLKQALTSDLDTAIVIGYTKDGEEYYVSNEPNGANVLWLLQRIQLRLLREAN